MELHYGVFNFGMGYLCQGCLILERGPATDAVCDDGEIGEGIVQIQDMSCGYRWVCVSLARGRDVLVSQEEDALLHW